MEILRKSTEFRRTKIRNSSFLALLPVNILFHQDYIPLLLHGDYEFLCNLFHCGFVASIISGWDDEYLLDVLAF